MSERITAMDVEKQEFRRKVRGYDSEEVDLYLRSVAEEITRLNLDNARLLEENGKLARQVAEQRTREKTLQETLVTAQKMSEDIQQRSKDKADRMVHDARLESERVLRDTQDQLARLESEISRARLDRDLFEKRLRETVEEHLEMLDRRRADRESTPDNVRPMRRATLDIG